MEDDLANNKDPINNNDVEIEDANIPTFKEKAKIPNFENANVIIIDDSDEEEEEDRIVNTDAGMITKEEIVQKKLKNEVELVKELLAGASVIPPNDEIYAYLEHHLKEVNRVRIVAEELWGDNDMSFSHSHEASLIRDFDHNEPKGKTGKGTYRKGGKVIVKGKKEKVMGIRAITPETRAEEENTNLRPEKRPHGEETDEKFEPLKQQMKWNPTEDANLQHGPFDLIIIDDPIPLINRKEVNAAPFGEVRPDIVTVQQVPELIDITGDVEISADPFGEVKPDIVAVQQVPELIDITGDVEINASPFGEVKPVIVAVQQVPELIDITGDIETNAAPFGEVIPAIVTVQQVPELIDITRDVRFDEGPSTAPNILPIPGSSSDEPVPSTSFESFVHIIPIAPKLIERLQYDPMEETEDEMWWDQEKEAYLKAIFPDISPEWLLEQIRSFRIASGTHDDAGLNVRVSDIMEMNKSKIPSRKEWEKKIKEQEELDKWTGNKTVKDMFDLYEDDPASHFHNPNRVIPNKQLYSQHSRVGLMDAFRFISTDDIDKVLKHSKMNYVMAYKAINKLDKSRKTKRANAEIKYPPESCIEFLKEKKFVELQAAIEEEKVRRENDRRAAFEIARATNSLIDCGCCFGECLKEDMLPCKGGHLYCKECISRGAMVAIGDGKTIIQCLGKCLEEIATRELQKVLPSNVLSKLLSKRQAEEVGAANIENLVMCPFCPYSIIMENKEDKVLVCRNPECGRDSCRLCRQPNHIPKRCEELESQDEERARKGVEEALSDAIIRKCANPNCSARFTKTEGCNKVCCETCKTTQCYLCKSVVTGYNHFYGQGDVPTENKVCPLHSDNDELRALEIARVAQKETAELQKKGIKLKLNPMKDIQIPDKNGVEDNWPAREHDHQAPDGDQSRLA